MPSHSVHVQLFGIALLLVGGLWNLQRNVVDAYSTSGLASILVLMGFLAVVAGLLAPLAASSETDDGEDTAGEADA